MLDVLTDKLKIFKGETNEKIDACLLLVGIVVCFTLKSIGYTQYEWTSAKWKVKTRATL